MMVAGGVHAQVQKGVEIVGENGIDRSGCSVSMPNANTVAIGAYLNDGTANDAGHVRVYSWDGSAWGQKGSDIDGEAADDESGYSVSMPDVNTVAIGAPFNQEAGFEAGHVRVYAWDVNTSDWTQKGGDIDGEAAGDRSGWSVSMGDNNTVAIGAHFNDGVANGSGHVRIFSWDGSAWVQKGADIDGTTGNDQLGYSVSMADANTVAVGVIGFDGTASAAGQVRVYTWDANTSSWVQKGLGMDGEALGDQFGYTVSMADSNTVGVGTPFNDGNGNSAGHARVYAWNGTAWVQKGLDIDGEALEDNSAFSISMGDSNSIAIGARLNDDAGNNAGHTRVFSWDSGTNAWVQNGMDIDGVATNVREGWSVSMPNANTVATGATEANSSAGGTRVFSFCNYTNGTDIVTACDSYTWLDGITYTSDNSTATYTLVNAAGCDSLVTLNLTINPGPDVSTSSSNGVDITANNASATYQWLDCDNGNAIIANETSQTYTATSNGNYAVEITENGCVDTSACVTVSVVGLEEYALEGIDVYPNPTSQDVNVHFQTEFGPVDIEVLNALGQTIAVLERVESNEVIVELPEPKELYFIVLNFDNKKIVRRVVKE